jgi:hypothetical protein
VSDIDFLAAFAYSTGQDPIDYAAVNVIAAHIDAHFNPSGFPGETDPATAELALRIAGDLLDAGWTAPQLQCGPEVTP